MRLNTTPNSVRDVSSNSTMLVRSLEFSFPPRLIALPRLMNSICLTIMVSQKFCHNVRHNLAGPNDFAEVVNYTRLWDVELTWYSLWATHQICPQGLEHSLRIHNFRPTWPCLIAEVLITQAKFVKPSVYCALINCIFTFCAKCFFFVTSTVSWPSSELIKCKFLN